MSEEGSSRLKRARVCMGCWGVGATSPWGPRRVVRWTAVRKCQRGSGQRSMATVTKSRAMSSRERAVVRGWGSMGLSGCARSTESICELRFAIVGGAGWNSGFRFQISDSRFQILNVEVYHSSRVWEVLVGKRLLSWRARVVSSAAVAQKGFKGWERSVLLPGLSMFSSTKGGVMIGAIRTIAVAAVFALAGTARAGFTFNYTVTPGAGDLAGKNV